MHLWLEKVSVLSEYEYTFFMLKLFHENELQVFHLVRQQCLFSLSYENIRSLRFYKANICWFVKFILSISYY